MMELVKHFISLAVFQLMKQQMQEHITMMFGNLQMVKIGLKSKQTTTLVLKTRPIGLQE